MTSAPTRRSSTSGAGMVHCWPPSWRRCLHHAAFYTTSRWSSRTPNLLRENHVADRIRIAAGSFFESVPADGDAYVLKNIIHDWPDDKALQILRNVRAATQEGATVLLVESVIPPHDREFSTKWL